METSSLLRTLDLSIAFASWTSTTSRLRSARLTTPGAAAIPTTQLLLAGQRCAAHPTCLAVASAPTQEGEKGDTVFTHPPHPNHPGAQSSSATLVRGWVWLLVFASGLIMATAIAISQSFRRLFLHPAHALLNIIELRSFFFGVVCFAVLLILAYLTNPSEASFRTFLTEQSFRRHLTKLTDTDKDSDSISEAKRYTLPSHDPHPATARSLPASYAYRDHVASNQPLRFHFANRVAISLQTPSHIFRSFGLFTAVVTPLVDTSSHGTYQSPEDNGKSSPWSPDGKMRGSWFIGAFGKWWIGGTIELSKRDIETLTAHESLLFKAALCNVRTMDYGDAYEGLRTALVPQMKIKKPKSKSSRSIEPEPSIKQTATPLPSRSGTPPLLGKHATRRSQKAGSNAPPIQKTRSSSITKKLVTSPAYAIENAPIITDAMKQISDAQSAVSDLRSQLQSFQSNAFASHATLQTTLDEHKARKRLEDSARAELKSRTKVLEDNKRQAETGKRDAEKKLKAAHAARDSATNRIQRLGRDIDALKKRIARDDVRILKSHTDAAAVDAKFAQELIQKRSDLKATEDEVSQLSARARELEQLVGQERIRLQSLQEEALRRLQNSQHHPSPRQGELAESWVASSDPFEWPMQAVQPPRRNLSQPVAPPPELREVFNSPTVRRTHALSLGRLPDAMIPTPAAGTPGSGDYAVEAPTRVIAPFSPFNAEPPERRSNPLGASLLPTNLVNSIDNEIPSDLEAFHLISPVVSSFDFSHLSVETPRTPLNFPASWGAPNASILYESSQNEPSMATNALMSSPRPFVETFLPTRSWPPKPPLSSTKAPQKSGLNPDAPIFQPPSHRLHSLRPSVPPDSVIAHAEAPAIPLLASTKPPRFTSLSAARAFAPSPEEREALQRAFGGTQNVSLERLSMGVESPVEHGGLMSRLPISPFVLPPDPLMDEVEWGLSGTRKGQGTAE